MTNAISFTAGDSLSNYLANSPKRRDMKTRFYEDDEFWDADIPAADAVDLIVDRYLIMIMKAFPLMHSETWFAVLDSFNSRTEISTAELFDSNPATRLLNVQGMDPDDFCGMKKESKSENESFVRAVDEVAELTVFETMAMVYCAERFWGGNRVCSDIRTYLAKTFYRPESLVFRDDFEDYGKALWSLWDFRELPARSDDLSPGVSYKCTHLDYEGLECTLRCVRQGDERTAWLLEGPEESALTHTHYMMGVDLRNEVIRAFFHNTA